MVDKAKCDQILDNLRGFVADLRRLSKVATEEFLKDQDKANSAKYSFVVAIEACIDLANHIISSENLRIPKDNADSFLVLIENDILDESKKETHQAMARFRNRLVHLYWDVNDRQVYGYLQTQLSDLEDFANDIAAYASTH